MNEVKIIDVRAVLLTGPATLDPFLSVCRRRRSVALIEIETNAKITGVGETYAGYFCPEVVPPIVDFFKPILLGQNVGNIDELWGRMYHCGNFWCRVGLGLSVINGIEAALWDVKGRLENKPVYELLGGLKHDSLPAYATGGPSNYPLEKLAAKLELYLSLGFKGVKLGVGAHSTAHGHQSSNDPSEAADFEAAKLEFVRRNVGPDIELMLDGHMGNSPSATWSLGTAQAVMKAVEPYKLLFFEEPLRYTDLQSYTELCQTTPVPIAGGECLTGACEWRVFVERDCFDIGQPDASFTGGMGQVVTVADMLARRGRKIATHSWGAGASCLQNIHAAFACQNTLVVEVPPAFGPLHSEMMGDSFQMREGRLFPPRSPGLGIALTPEIKNRFPFVPGSGEFNSVPGKIMEEELSPS
ncbi:MAG TPA: mandelate racemase/muconate lactonizing enzyme family protein [Candidatus Saccharimonadales bacterium]|nr:mandelate racemase/muconate lactonizing enzyme family protein [Candidatus Saccharimonadales bacterium]